MYLEEKTIAESGIQKPDYVVTGKELLESEVEEIPMLWKPFFPTSGLVGLIGGSDTGKSTLMRDFAMSVASGKEQFLDYQMSAKHQSVLYVSTEDDKNALSYLLKLQNANNDPTDDFEGLRFIFGSENLKERILKEYERAPFDCVIIDAFADIFIGDINRNNDVRTFLQEFLNHSAQHNYLVVFIHHSGKATEFRGPSKHNSIGSQGFEAKMRLVIELCQDPEDGRIRHFCPVKGNYLPYEMKSKSLKLKFNKNLKYENTGETEGFDDLTYRMAYKDKRAELRLVHELKGKGMSSREIAVEATELGYKMGKTKVAELCNQSLN